MSPFLQVEDIPDFKIVPGIVGKMIHTDQMTVAHVRIEAGSVLPEHHHVHEQITNIISGELELTVAGETQVCTAGMSVVIPSHVPHSARALTDCYAIDVFQPARTEYR